jgi:proline racemase
LDDGTKVEYDIAFGGAFYAYCNVGQLNLGLGPKDYRKLIEIGTQIKQKVMKSVVIKHPIESDLGFLYGFTA